MMVTMEDGTEDGAESGRVRAMGCIFDFGFLQILAQASALAAATCLIQDQDQISNAAKDSFNEFPREIGTSQFFHPTALRADCFEQNSDMINKIAIMNIALQSRSE